MILSAIAVLLAAGALVAAVAIPGPAGPQGATGAAGTDGTDGARGPQGPPGNGTLMTSFSYGLLDVGASCTDESPSFSLAAPSAGTIAVTGSVSVGIAHTTGAADDVVVYVSVPGAGGDCYQPAGSAVVPAALGSDLYEITVPVAVTWPASAAGTYALTISGAVFASSASNNAAFSAATGYAVFYPS